MSFINWVKCKLGFHDFYVVRNLSEVAQKIACRRCHRMWGLNHKIRAIIPWDREIESFYEERAERTRDL